MAHCFCLLLTIIVILLVVVNGFPAGTEQQRQQRKLSTHRSQLGALQPPFQLRNFDVDTSSSSLSIVIPIDILRQRFLRETKLRQQANNQVLANREYLNKVGRRR